MKAVGLYDPGHERDSCGVGFVLNLDGRAEHRIVEKGIEVLENLLHRGATGADPDTGDGAGLLIQIPDGFFREEAKRLGFDLPPRGSYGVGALLLPPGGPTLADTKSGLQRILLEEGLTTLGWREVPVDPMAVGETARASMPSFWQIFAADPKGRLKDDALERKLLVVRKRAEHELGSKESDHSPNCYASSFSSRTVIYKGMMIAPQVPRFYPDLRDIRMVSALAVVHQRYSTNTFPSWPLAQPFRLLAHNGEINTLRGNRNQMATRERRMKSELFGDDLAKLPPILEEFASDSANLDNALELLALGGREIHHALLMLVPQAWGQKYPMGPDLRGFFEYHSGLMEPWDGPAAVAFTDGRLVGAALDRNGLRPVRYTVTKDGFMVLASEAGVLDIPADQIAERGSLRPGTMLMADLATGRLMKDAELKMHLARRKPYRRWVEENHISIHGFFGAVNAGEGPAGPLRPLQRLFGYTREDIRVILDGMAVKGYEPVGSMGSDQPLAVLSEKPQLLYWYFKQLFAQITNPAIDPIREELVMSLMTYLGNNPNILAESPVQARLVKLQHPILSNADLARIRNLNSEHFRAATLPTGFAADAAEPGAALERALEELAGAAMAQVKAGTRILVLSDRELPGGQAPIPALLAVAAVNQALRTAGLRTDVGLLLETGEAREVMHIALLLGFGATAINPYLAFASVVEMSRNDELTVRTNESRALVNYIHALNKGLMKIMSKMGISTLRSYRNAQVFEAVGLSQGLVDRYFKGTSSRVGGIGLDEIAREALARFEDARQAPPEAPLPAGGQYAWRADGERHLWTAQSISALQQSTRNGDWELYKKYAAMINDQAEKQSTLRGLFQMKPAGPAVPLEEVEPEEAIMRRFMTGAMSFGSLGKEVHETLAIAMNSIGGRSNSGEGGEDPARYKPGPNGENLSSAIKQIASGRFGVTAEYLNHAKELQIKISQGAKPGEGGQLPGHKVTQDIARVRHSTPGVTLISPPPHHDIYSIEDIAQLIYDLRCSNDEAEVSVKLVAESGVGTVAAGVAKARADRVLISGYDGGTGASPLSSIKHAGIPWEIGLAETQQTLVLNRLRDRIRVQTDGQIKTGRDVVIGALLGAEEFGFATSSLVVCGCMMLRKCHTNGCAFGVATQDPELRKRYSGKPEHVIQFFRFIAREVREIMASLGFRAFDELVGRSDLLNVNPAITFWKAKGLDFSAVFHRVDAKPEECRFTNPQPSPIADALDYRLLPQVQPAIDGGDPVVLRVPVRNTDRAVGTVLSSRIARRHGHKGLPDGRITLELDGSAGQSFGAFAAKGLTLILNGEGNDYLGKGLSGGKIVVKPAPGATFDPARNTIAGNVLLYGATCGEAYLNGCVGERFAVRNSGAWAVVEGVGDHGCEYMTGGRVAILGPTGVNFAAGMSGGIAYVLDENGMFDARCNLEMVDLESLSLTDERELRGMIERHAALTGSPRAKRILADWHQWKDLFVKVLPMEYRFVLGQMTREDAETQRAEKDKE
jgi:glutamate synthase domain-containing protein 2/glutamate synthase domain-containing protein 1/glutamate synthase domain-containing protein 3